MFWPSRLAVLYPHPFNKISMWQVALSALLLLAVSIWVIRLARSRRYIPVGWLWYLGTMVPVIGLVQTGAHAMADRFTYLPSIGILIVIAWGTAELLSKWRYRKIVLGALTLIVLLALSICTRLQLRHWRNSITLFEHALEVTTDNNTMHDNLGLTLQSQGRFDEAVTHHRHALRIDPEDPDTHFNLGQALISQGKLDEAITHFTEVIRTKPDFADAHRNLAYALGRQGKLDEAIPHFIKSLQIEPDNAEVHVNLGVALARQGKLEEAIKHYTEALRIKPDFADAHYSLGVALAQQGKLEEAITHFTEALRIRPNFAGAQKGLEKALLLRKNRDEK